MEHMPRTAFFSLCSLLVNAIALTLLAHSLAHTRTPEAKRPPIVLNLAPEAPRQLVETSKAAEKPPEQTNAISDKNAAAADEEPTDGDKQSPLPDVVDENLQMASAPAHERQPAPPPPASPMQPPAAPPQLALPEDPIDQRLNDLLGETVPGQDQAREEPERLARAQDPTQAQEPASAESAPRQRLHAPERNVKRIGQTNFTAIEDEIAPYLLKIQRRVRQRWYAALLTRYSGTQPTLATITCAIAPSGELVWTKIQGRTDERVYAGLCKRAIEEAAPFGPFPFVVPDIYRDKNLEIRWTFNFLKE